MSTSAVVRKPGGFIADGRAGREGIDRIRAAIASADAERKAAFDLPRSAAEIEEGADNLVRQLSLMGLNLIPTRRLSRRDETLTYDAIVAAAAEFPIAFAVALAPEKFRELLLDGQPRNGVTLQERQRLLDEIDDRRLCLLAAEEIALRELDEATGTHVERRRDIADDDLDILVAPSSELRPFAEKAQIETR